MFHALELISNGLYERGDKDTKVFEIIDFTLEYFQFWSGLIIFIKITA